MLLSVSAWIAGCVTDFDRQRLPSDREGCEGRPACAAGISCCADTLVPGGRVDRGWDASDDPTQDGVAIRGWQARGAAPAIVSPFRLAVFEVTVGRMRDFVAQYDALRAAGRPAAGEGAIPRLGPSSGWRAEHDASLPPDRAALEAELRCGEPGESTYDAVDDRVAINCVSWYVAYALCISAGGRLPSEAEWSFAAAGGDEQRAFPWSDPAASLDVGDARIAGFEEPGAVGSAPGDVGRYLQRDLGGNLREWVLDGAYGLLDAYLEGACEDCVDTRDTIDRVRRGGDFAAGAERARSASRGSSAAGAAEPYNGVRCAFDL